MDRKVLAVIGPTASGKTRLAVALAKRFGAEVVCADSMQIYRDMPVATAAATPEEQAGVPHHLLSFLPPGQAFSVAQYTQLARERIEEIAGRGVLPIIAGGTGLYIDALLDNLRFLENSRDDGARDRWTRFYEENGAEALYLQLRRVDPKAAEGVHPNNIKRVIRALEVYEASGRTISYQVAQSRREPSGLAACRIGIDYQDRQILYDRINRRVDSMMRQGLLEEARRILDTQTIATARQAIGHKELAPYLRGEITLEEAVENLKRQSRRYAKRQRTWFYRNQTVHWLYADTMRWDELEQRAAEIAEEFLRG
ncbi:MAG: tRNA (adenosine(37)-N6)-dimethylallyltransferase MiaA [Clostridiales bacterium]|nr:tRNA (adenosine(37)-N6)-dimethylallyltransferase MiaA [Clostridiales bacterium]